MNKWFGKIVSVVAVVFWAAVAVGWAGVEDDRVPEKLRVGFFEFSGYHNIDKEGVRSGYGYDVIQMLRPYLHCQYEYVGYEKGWTEMLPMLERGEIDFVTSAVKTEEKLKKFDFSDVSIGNSSIVLTVKPGEKKYHLKDYAHWSGMRVGMIAENSKNDVFAQFAKEKGFTYEAHYYHHTDELGEALKSEEVDAILSGSLRKIGDEVIFEEFDVQPFYVIVKKGNKQLLDKINEALRNLRAETPGFAGELEQLHYGKWRNNLSKVALTAAENEFVQDAKEANRRFVVLLQPEQYPLEYVKDGKPKGVFVDIVRMMEKSSGLDFELFIPKDLETYFRLRDERKCDLIMDSPHSFQWAESMGYIQSKPYYPIASSMLTKKRSLGEIYTVGTLKDSVLERYALKNKPKDVKIKVYPSNKAVIEAVKKGEVDGGYLLGPVVENAILNDRTGTLTQVRSSRVTDFSIAIRDNVQEELISILCKCVNNFSKEEILKISRDNNLLLEREVRFREWISENPVIFSLIVFGLIALLSTALVVMYVSHRRAARAAALLKKNTRMWKALLDTLPIHIFAKEVEGFRHLFCNQARADFFARTCEEMINVRDEEYLPKELAQQQEMFSRELVAHPREYHEQFFRLANAKGEVRDLHIIQKTFVDKDGSKMILGCAIDLTELESARRQAQENAQWLKKTLISIGDGVLTTDREGKITLLNPIAEKMLGVKLAECKGRPHMEYFNIVSYVDDTPVSSPVERCLMTGEIVTLANHTDLLSRNGTRYHIADSAAPILATDGSVAGAVLVFRDVTKEYDLRDELKKKAVQLKEALLQTQQASEAKGVFLSQMSHEIRTPLNAIIGYLSLALESEEDQKKIKECLLKGTSASKHLLSIINDILDISSIESGKLKISNEDFDFKQLLTGIVSMFYTQAEEKKIHFEMNLRKVTEEWLVGDSLRVNQILLNLLSNALKFTPEGGRVALTVEQVGIIKGRVQLRMEVADTGCGMSQEYQKRIFQSFEQQDASIARRYGGTGLGLSITKSLVDMMGGKIEVESRENEGSSFRIYISFERSVKGLQSADVDFSKLRALVVDDRQEDREYIQMVLTKCKVKSDAVSSGEEAIEQLERRMASHHPYDFCLLDLKLSGMDGIETARRMRSLKNEDGLPIILVSAYDTVAISEKAHEAGVNKIIQKPLFQSTFFDFLMSNYYQKSEKKNGVGVKEGLKGLKILLVEDNEMNMDISTQYLKRAGMEITQAWNGKEAVEVFEKSAPGSFQVILMDVQMPVMDGYSATEKIRASAHPEAKTMPIIAMTANAFNEDVVRALSVGMNDHVSKPIQYDRLFDSLSKLIHKER